MRTIIKNKFLLLVVSFLLIGGTITAQDVTIHGSENVFVNSTETYYFDLPSGAGLVLPQWYISKGTIVSQSGTSVTINWTNSGTGSVIVSFSSGQEGYYGELFVTITNFSDPATPPNPIVAVSNCQDAVLQRVGTVPSGVTWYWQGQNPNGTSTSLGSGLNFTITSSGTYYIRARKNSTGVWSTDSGSKHVNIGTVAGSLWYRDYDNDGFGGSSTIKRSCTQPSGYVSNNSDCNDNNSAIHPNTVWFKDQDGDGFGNSSISQTSCTQPSSEYVIDGGDCDDNNMALNPDTLWYSDTADGDSFGDPNQTIQSCSQPSGYVANNSDVCPSISGIYYGCTTPQTGSVSLNNDENYVHTITYQEPYNKGSEGNASKQEKIETVAYFDGLGRAKQQVAIRAGGQGEDIITPIEYDGFGRQVKDYLPYASIANSGSYREDALLSTLTSANNFYNTAKYEYTLNAYSEKHFETSPLNRVKKQAAPGDSWVLNKSNDTDHTIKFNYKSNTGSEVKIYTVGLAFANNTYTPTLNGGSSYYLANELYKTITKDENWTSGTNHTTEEFKDKQGRVILKRNYNNGAHDTYYVYDDYGNLTYVLPPKAEPHTAKPDATELSELCYQYKYDDRNRLVEKKIPGKGWESIVYNKLDQPIMTQDENLDTQNKWLFTKYDALGRVAYTGFSNTGVSRLSLQTTVNGVFSQWVVKGGAISLGGATSYYNNGAYPTTVSEIHTFNYYDDYTFDKSGLVVPSSSYGESIVNYNNANKILTRGLTTGSKVKVLGQNGHWVTTITGYDDKSRPIWVGSYNSFLQTTDIVESKLDFIGKVLETKTTHKKTGKTDIVTIDRFEYDHTGRLTENKQYINNSEAELIARNHYDELGQLIKKDVGGKLSNSPDQFKDIANLDVGGLTITKTYNSNSWNGGLATIGEIPSDGYIEYEIPQTNKYIMVGLSSDNSSASYNTIDYAIYNHASARIYVYESGSYKGYKTTYKAGDIFKVERIGNIIYYKKNDAIFYTSTVNSNGKLIGDISIHTYLGKIKNLHVSSTYKDLVGVTEADNIVTSTAGTGWNSGFATTESFSNNGYVQHEITQTGKYLMVGLSSDNTNANYNTIDYAIYHYSTNRIYVYESGSNKGYKTTYSVGDIFKVERKGSIIYYKKNDVVFYTSTITSTGTLIGDISFYHKKAKIKDLKIVDNSKGLQTLDYTYNIRGWLKQINDVNNLSDDLFSFNINYDNPTTGTALYNGNISQTQWKTDNTDSSLKTYTYAYDALDRIVSATDNTTDQRYSLTNVLYDKNGNIENLVRNGHRDLGATSFGVMDDLTYNYLPNSNKLMKVTDAATIDQFGFKDDALNTASDTTDDYSYDSNGNLLTDTNKGITSVLYNHLNMPTEIKFNNSDTKKINYVYAADRTKLRKTTNDNGNVTTTDYAGNYVYENNTLQFFNHPEGYVEPNANGSGFIYTYQYLDNLKNVRLSYSDLDGNGTISQSEIKEENNYYPGGLKHKGYNTVVTGREHKYKFNGKELQKELGFNLYDYGARYYDPALLRFTTIDPKAEDYDLQSPYVYAANNPIYFIDKNGEGPEDCCGGFPGLKTLGRAFISAVDEAFPDNPVAQFYVGFVGSGIETMSDPIADMTDGIQSDVSLANAVASGDTGEILRNTPVVGDAINSVEGTVKMAEGVANGDMKAIGQATFTATAIIATKKIPGAKGKSLKNPGRSGKQARLKELGNDPKVSKADRGWIKNERRHIKNGNRKSIRLPGNSRRSKKRGKELAHPRGKRAKDGNSYKDAKLQDADLHKLEHKHSGY